MGEPFLSRTLGHGPHVEDLAQETFLRAFRALPRFDATGPARPSTWLLTIATRLVQDERRKRRHSLQPLEAGVRAVAAGTPETERSRAELGRALFRARERLRTFTTLSRPRRVRAPAPIDAADAGHKVIVPACDCVPDQVICTCF